MMKMVLMGMAMSAAMTAKAQEDTEVDSEARLASYVSWPGYPPKQTTYYGGGYRGGPKQTDKYEDECYGYQGKWYKPWEWKKYGYDFECLHAKAISDLYHAPKPYDHYLPYYSGSKNYYEEDKHEVYEHLEHVCIPYFKEYAHVVNQGTLTIYTDDKGRGGGGSYHDPPKKSVNSDDSPLGGKGDSFKVEQIDKYTFKLKYVDDHCGGSSSSDVAVKTCRNPPPYTICSIEPLHGLTAVCVAPEEENAYGVINGGWTLHLAFNECKKGCSGFSFTGGKPNNNFANGKRSTVYYPVDAMSTGVFDCAPNRVKDPAP